MMMGWARAVPWAGERRTDSIYILEVNGQDLQMNMKQEEVKMAPRLRPE